MFRAISVFCVLWPVFWLTLPAFAWPLSVRIAPAGHEPWIIWTSEWLWRWRWTLTAFNGAGTLLVWAYVLKLSRRLNPEERSCIRWMAPLLLLALLFSSLLMKDEFPAGVTASALFYLPLFVASFPILYFMRKWTLRDTFLLTVPQITLVAAVGAALFWLTGMAYTHWCGPISGDEGHYLIVAESLYHDGDLDIRNQYEQTLGDQRDHYIENNLLEERLHISPLSRGEYWYSYHAPGIAFLSAWTVPYGAWARHIVLCLVAGSALAGMCLLCRLAGAGQRASLAIILIYACSLYNVVYASRFIPEMLGVALILWLMVAIFTQERCQAFSAIGATVIVSVLPWAHLRFLPASLAGAGFYILRGLLLKEADGNKVRRLVGFVAGSGIGLLIYHYFQTTFFKGGFSHGVGALFMEHPEGIVRTFTNPAGLADVFPLSLLLVPCGLLGWRLNPEKRLLLLLSAGLFLVTWITTCSGCNYGAGASLSGRFLVSVMPLLIPALALYWGVATLIERWWLLILGLISAGLCILQLAILPGLGMSFTYPYDSTPIVLPVLWGWHLPWPGANYIYVVVLVHAILIFWSGRARRFAPWLIGLLLVGLLAGNLRVSGRPSNERPHHRGTVAGQLARMNLFTAHVKPRRATGAVRLFTISNLLVNRFDKGYDGDHPLRITTEKRESVHEEATISQPLVDRNDWEGRGWQWVTLWPPASFGAGEMAFSLQGLIVGNARAVVALREGSRTIIEQPLSAGTDGRVTFQCRLNIESPHSRLYMLVHLIGEGQFVVDELALSPVSDRLLVRGGFAE